MINFPRELANYIIFKLIKTSEINEFEFNRLVNDISEKINTYNIDRGILLIKILYFLPNDIIPMFINLFSELIRDVFMVDFIKTINNFISDMSDVEINHYKIWIGIENYIIKLILIINYISGIINMNYQDIMNQVCFSNILSKSELVNLLDDRIKDDRLNDGRLINDNFKDDIFKGSGLQLQNDSLTDDRLKDSRLINDNLKGDIFKGSGLQLQNDSLTDDRLKDSRLINDNLKGDIFKGSGLQNDNLTDDKLKDDDLKNIGLKDLTLNKKIKMFDNNNDNYPLWLDFNPPLHYQKYLEIWET